MELMERWFEEVWNKGREEAIDAMCAPDVVAHGLVQGTNDIIGVEAYKTYYRAFQSAMSEIHVHIDKLTVDGERQTAECDVTGRHTGEGLGIPPRGRLLSFTGTVIATVRDGVFVEVWNYFDFDRMIQQMQE